MPSMNRSPVVASEKPRRRMSSSPPSAAWKVTPAVLRSTSFRLSRLRSSISFSVTTVMDCGMLRNSWLPLPMVVVVARTESLPSGVSAFSLTVTWFSVLSAALGVPAGGDCCAMALMEPASSMAPRGNRVEAACGLLLTLELSGKAGFGINGCRLRMGLQPVVRVGTMACDNRRRPNRLGITGWGNVKRHLSPDAWLNYIVMRIILVMHFKKWPHRPKWVARINLRGFGMLNTGEIGL